MAPFASTLMWSFKSMSIKWELEWIISHGQVINLVWHERFTARAYRSVYCRKPLTGLLITFWPFYAPKVMTDRQPVAACKPEALTGEFRCEASPLGTKRTFHFYLELPVLANLMYSFYWKTSHNTSLINEWHNEWNRRWTTLVIYGKSFICYRTQ